MDRRAWIIFGIIAVALGGFFYAFHVTHVDSAAAPANNPNIAGAPK
jgi:hypothetical protein